MKKRRIRRKKYLKNFLTFTLIIFVCSLILSFCTKNGHRRDADSKIDLEYLKKHEEIAQNIGKKYGLFPSVVLAQSALESNFGKSRLATDFNNYFGIKSNGDGDEIKLETTEFVDGEKIVAYESFRVYKNPLESFDHYGRLISEAKRYKDVLDAKTYDGAAVALQKCGYATDPDYASKIINIIEIYELTRLD